MYNMIFTFVFCSPFTPDFLIGVNKFYEGVDGARRRIMVKSAGKQFISWQSNREKLKNILLLEHLDNL